MREFRKGLEDKEGELRKLGGELAEEKKLLESRFGDSVMTGAKGKQEKDTTVGGKGNTGGGDQ